MSGCGGRNLGGSLLMRTRPSVEGEKGVWSKERGPGGN